MAKAGRKRKAGRRTDSGRPSRAGAIPAFDRGTDQAQQRRELFAGDGYDAIGRAYVMGLLGEGQEAKARLDIGRRYAAAYRAEYHNPYRCPLDDTVRGLSHVEGTNDRREWVDAQSAKLDDCGSRPYTDQLVDPLHVHTDGNPPWLERMLDTAIMNKVLAATRRVLLRHDERDEVVLVAALKGLDAMLSPIERRDAVALARAA